jgi:hypothetical protein
LADGLECECRQRCFGVYEELGDAFFLRDDALGVCAKVAAERFDGGFVDREAGSGLVTAVGYPVVAAGGEGGVEIEAADAGPGHAGSAPSSSSDGIVGRW